jgi:hypothetical protein
MVLVHIVVMALHILCAVILVGGAIAWRFGAIPGIQLLEAETRTKVDNAIAATWKPVLFFAIAGVLLSGIVNLIEAGQRTPRFHMVFGLKMLAVLHLLAVSVLATRADNPRRSRQLTGVVVSGVIIVILSAALRWV